MAVFPESYGDVKRTSPVVDALTRVTQRLEAAMKLACALEERLSMVLQVAPLEKAGRDGNEVPQGSQLEQALSQIHGTVCALAGKLQLTLDGLRL